MPYFQNSKLSIEDFVEVAKFKTKVEKHALRNFLRKHPELDCTTLHMNIKAMTSTKGRFIASWQFALLSGQPLIIQEALSQEGIVTFRDNQQENAAHYLAYVDATDELIAFLQKYPQLKDSKNRDGGTLLECLTDYCPDTQRVVAFFRAFPEMLAQFEGYCFGRWQKTATADNLIAIMQSFPQVIPIAMKKLQSEGTVIRVQNEKVLTAAKTLLVPIYLEKIRALAPSWQKKLKELRAFSRIRIAGAKEAYEAAAEIAISYYKAQPMTDADEGIAARAALAMLAHDNVANAASVYSECSHHHLLYLCEKLKQRALQKDTSARKQLLDYSHPEAKLKAGEYYYAKHDYKKAREMFAAALEGGVKEAHVFLGDCQERGLGGKKDKKAAVMSYYHGLPASKGEHALLGLTADPVAGCHAKILIGLHYNDMRYLDDVCKLDRENYFNFIHDESICFNKPEHKVALYLHAMENTRAELYTNKLYSYLVYGYSELSADAQGIQSKNLMTAAWQYADNIKRKMESHCVKFSLSPYTHDLPQQYSLAVLEEAKTLAISKQVKNEINDRIAKYPPELIAEYARVKTAKTAASVKLVELDEPVVASSSSSAVSTFSAGTSKGGMFGGTYAASLPPLPAAPRRAEYDCDDEMIRGMTL